ncbi:pyridoxal phosphate-dependent aminotransferase [Priestia endophytica]|uniref:Aminotransferase n=1 Tax=Priestia endophytica TaxID=135735 RepID=A0AAX1Q3D6_9BACI|nr:pyridoxal phosphate-dependent aminotransferase [Priestia endophytica]RAS72066.1 aspartate aminotransferase [Priestia endophytica]RAS89701.1 aspartate aminotransferase [Priestia endophytica]
MLANRVSSLTPSATLAITAKARELREEGYDVIGLGAGEPDFNTPHNILEQAKKAMEQGYTKYTPSGGLLSLKKAVSAKFERDQNLHYDASEIIICTGAKHALYMLFQAVLNEGDEVLIPTPYWVSYPEQVKLAGGAPVFIKTYEENEFKITISSLQEAVTSNTKAIVLNSPSNPTGMIYTREELEMIGKFCVQHNILIISDEIYEKLVYDKYRHVSIAELSEDIKKQTIIINGVSKSHAMTGWRIGYAAGDKQIIKAMTNLASHSTSNPTSIAQYAAIEAYNGDQSVVEEMRVEFQKRLNIIYEELIKIPGITCLKPHGAFYLFPTVSKAANLAGYDTVDKWVEGLLDEAKVALVPGSGFGAPHNARLSYATSLDELGRAVERIRNFMKNRMNA